MNITEPIRLEDEGKEEKPCAWCLGHPHREKVSTGICDKHAQELLQQIKELNQRRREAALTQ